jgi:hypothetical protein
VQAALLHVGDVRAGGVGPGVDDGAVDAQRHLTGGQVEGVELAREREHRDGEARVDGVVEDAAAGLTGPFAPRALFGGQLLLAGQQLGGVDELGLGAGGQVGRPEAVPGVGARLRAQEQHAGAVRGDPELLRRTEGEALGPGLLAEEREVVDIGHARTLPDDHDGTPTPLSLASSASGS